MIVRPLCISYMAGAWTVLFPALRDVDRFPEGDWAGVEPDADSVPGGNPG